MQHLASQLEMIQWRTGSHGGGGRNRLSTDWILKCMCSLGSNHLTDEPVQGCDLLMLSKRMALVLGGRCWGPDLGMTMCFAMCGSLLYKGIRGWGLTPDAGLTRTDP